MDSHIHESALPSSTTCYQSSANLAILSSSGGPLVTHLRQMLLDRLGRLKLLPHGSTPVSTYDARRGAHWRTTISTHSTN
jgi:hypothetical protein